MKKSFVYILFALLLITALPPAAYALEGGALDREVEGPAYSEAEPVFLPIAAEDVKRMVIFEQDRASSVYGGEKLERAISLLNGAKYLSLSGETAVGWTYRGSICGENNEFVQFTNARFSAGGSAAEYSFESEENAELWRKLLAELYAEGLENGGAEPLGCTRLEAAELLFERRLEGDQNSPIYEELSAEIAGMPEKIFDDVDGEAYGGRALKWLKRAGVVNGGGDGSFAPNRFVTREELAAMMYRLVEFKGIDTEKSAEVELSELSAKPSPWAEEALRWAEENAVFGEDSAVISEPKASLSAAEVREAIKRLGEYIYAQERGRLSP